METLIILETKALSITIQKNQRRKFTISDDLYKRVTELIYKKTGNNTDRFYIIQAGNK